MCLECNKSREEWFKMKVKIWGWGKIIWLVVILPCETHNECVWTSLWLLLLWRKLEINKAGLFSRPPWDLCLPQTSYRRTSIWWSGKSQKSTGWRFSGHSIKITCSLRSWGGPSRLSCWNECPITTFSLQTPIPTHSHFLPTELLHFPQVQTLTFSITQHSGFPGIRNFTLFRHLTKLWACGICLYAKWSYHKDAWGGGGDRDHQVPSKCYLRFPKLAISNEISTL